MASLPSKTLFCMPTGDAGARLWMLNFARHVAENLAAIGLTQEQSDRMTQAARAFDAAMSLASSPATRTTVTVWEKTEARNEAVKVRSLARLATTA